MPPIGTGEACRNRAGSSDGRRGRGVTPASDIHGHPLPASSRHRNPRRQLPPSARLPSSSRVPHRVVELGDGRHDGVVVLAPIHLRAASPQVVPPVRVAHGRSGASEQLLRRGDRPERLRGAPCASAALCGAGQPPDETPPRGPPQPGCSGRPLPLQTRPGPAPGSPGAGQPRPLGGGT